MGIGWPTEPHACVNHRQALRVQPRKPEAL